MPILGGPPLGPQIPVLQPPDRGGPVTIDDVVELLRNDRMRGFRIDVETDSLIEADQIQEKQSRTEFVRVVGQYFGQFGPLMQTMPAIAPMAAELLKFAIKGFKAGQSLEDVIDNSMDNIAKSSGAPNQQGAAAAQANQIKLQAEQIRLVGTQQKTQAEVGKARLGVQEAQIKAQTAMQQSAQQHAQTMQSRQAEHDMELMHNAQLHRQEMDRRAADMAQAQHDAEIEAAARPLGALQE